MPVTLSTGSIIGRYKVLSPLGAGGMGEVYLAEDTTLGRRVALKILPLHSSADEDRLRRFEQEARSASALNHPNIITIHEVGSQDGARFIATEFIEGETLRKRLKQTPLTPREAVDVAIQVASALAAAHQAGIIHRDIKPENVMLRPDGYVKVLDFGIVKLTEKFADFGGEQTAGAESGDARTSTVTTEKNVVMGSPNYMSPEQARGLAVDGRTDIFSLGVLIYEMLSAKKPFEGQTTTDIIVSILERRPQPLSQITEAPQALEHVVDKALAKDREARYQTVNELLVDLKRVKRRMDFELGLDDSFMPESNDESTVPITLEQDARTTLRQVSGDKSDGLTARIGASLSHLLGKNRRRTPMVLTTLVLIAVFSAALIYFSRGPAAPGGAAHTIDSIAVLPFVNESADPNTDYLSDGITESLINNLAQSRGLRVMSRNSVFRYKGRQTDARKVGRELGVKSVLNGRIVERGDNLSISIELIDARDDTQIWGDQYNRKLSDVLAMQEEIARQISQKLQLKLGGEDEQRINKHFTDDPEAYKLYLKGRFYWSKRTEDGLKKGIEYFNQAIEKDPSYALAYAGLADCYAIQVELEASPPTELYPKVKAAAHKALEIDDSLAEAHTSLGAAYEYEWNWAEAEQQYKRAVELNPSYATAHHWYAAYLISRLRSAEAIREMQRALELDPLSLIVNTSMGRVLYGAGQYDRAIEQLKKTLDMDTNFAEAHFQLGMVYEQKRMFDDSAREFQKAADLFNDPMMKAWVARTYALAGRKGDAERVLSEVKSLSKQKYASPYPMASIYAALGQKDAAFEWLERVYKDHSYYVVWLNIDRVFDGLRSDSRFQDLIDRIGIAPQGG
jgi:serine/threonine protein kinase/tetratricopeptide (TPR) repeat protein